MNRFNETENNKNDKTDENSAPLWHRKKESSSGARRARRRVWWLPAASIGIVMAIGLVVTLPAGSFARQMLPPELPMKLAEPPIDGGLALLAAAGGGYAIKNCVTKESNLKEIESLFNRV